jgi:polyvinyl alcohol dehydrogenase (cytochrome)
MRELAPQEIRSSNVYRIGILVLVVPGAIFAQQGACPANSSFAISSSEPAWNGWGIDLANSRFQSAQAAKLSAEEVPRLKLKWAFGLAGAKQVFGEPTVVGGRVFVSDDTGVVYSLDAASGCTYWTFHAESGVRTAVSIRTAKPSPIAYFGDLKANAYAVDATTGTLIWKVRADDHPTSRITGAPRVFEDRVYVPVASSEEGASSNPQYACCSFRGSVVALDAATGKQIWKTYTIADAPAVVSKNSNGVSRWAPAGGGVWNSPTIDP